MTGATGVLLTAAPLALSALGVAAILGGLRWVRTINRALAQLTNVAGTLTSLTGSLATVQADVDALRSTLVEHQREADRRWFLLGGLVPHQRYLAGDDVITVESDRAAG